MEDLARAECRGRSVGNCGYTVGIQNVPWNEARLSGSYLLDAFLSGKPPQSFRWSPSNFHWLTCSESTMNSPWSRQIGFSGWPL